MKETIVKADDEYYGMHAKIYISYDSSLRELASTLSNTGFGVEFYFETDMNPPHSESAMCEALGFEVTLMSSNEKLDYNYELYVESSSCLEASFAGRIHDMSKWLQAYISETTNLKTAIE